MKTIMLGNEAVARGLYEAGCRVASSYPGTPSTEVTEELARFDEIKCEWAPNEKVACEVAFGAAVRGARSVCAMKHVGLNVAADPVFTASYCGINAGMVIVVADDPGMHSSQNEQDSRNHAKASKIMMLEPADSDECLRFAKLAFTLSERFDTPVFLRLTTRVAHSRSLVETGERVDNGLKEYVKEPTKYVMAPANAIVKHPVVEQRLLDQRAYAETEALDAGLNKVEYFDKSIGVIASGICYDYAREALGERASYLKLGVDFPLADNLLKEFCAACGTVYVLEELDDFVEEHCKALGLDVIGKDKFPRCGEYSQGMIREIVLGEKAQVLTAAVDVPPRPPALCAGCPHRGLFYALKKLKLTVIGDIGCYTLGASRPLATIDTVLCMGASVSGLHGRNVADPENANRCVAVIGDSTFMHSGITGLVDIAYNGSNSVTIILDNSITGMTGHQNNPTNGKNIKGDPALAVDLEALCHAVGIEHVAVVDPYDIAQCESAVRDALALGAPAVIISRRPCALLKTVKHAPPLRVDRDACRSCKMCMQIGCPAIHMRDGRAEIDATQCLGCKICQQVCKFGAIVE